MRLFQTFRDLPLLPIRSNAKTSHPGAYLMPRHNFVLCRATTYEDCAHVLRLTGCGTVAQSGFVSHCDLV